MGRSHQGPRAPRPGWGWRGSDYSKSDARLKSQIRANPMMQHLPDLIYYSRYLLSTEENKNTPNYDNAGYENFHASRRGNGSNMTSERPPDLPLSPAFSGTAWQRRFQNRAKSDTRASS